MSVGRTLNPQGIQSTSAAAAVRCETVARLPLGGGVPGLGHHHHARAVERRLAEQRLRVFNTLAVYMCRLSAYINFLNIPEHHTCEFVESHSEFLFGEQFVH